MKIFARILIVFLLLAANFFGFASAINTEAYHQILIYSLSCSFIATLGLLWWFLDARLWWKLIPVTLFLLNLFNVLQALERLG